MMEDLVSNHRSYVGPPEYYDIIGGLQLMALMLTGMRETHTCVDIGCGSLRGGRFIMQYLLPGNYYGIEPNYWLVEDAIKHEVGRDMIDIKRPHFSQGSYFDLSAWNVQFDYILAQSIITHSPLTMVRMLMKEVSTSLNTHGKFIATVFIGQEDNKLTEWSYPDGVEWTVETINELAGEVGLIVSQLRLSHPAGQTWIVLTKSECIQTDGVSPS